MLRVRLKRVGAKQDPFYRVVVSESKLTPAGDFVDNLGTYDPGTDPATVKIDLPRAHEWIRKGARPSETVRSLLRKAQRSGG